MSLLLSAFGAQAQTPAQATSAADCQPAAPCYAAFTPDGAGDGLVHYYASAASGRGAPSRVLIALHGHGRDAGKTYAAALSTVQAAGLAAQTLIIAPLFQVDDAPDQGRGGRGCSSAGVPAPQAGDLLWSCSSWPAGEAALGGGPTSFAVLDALVQHLHEQWPSLQRATLGGFSAGGQLVQRYVGFAEAQAPYPMPVRYVVADPGSWLYFDPERPVPVKAGAVADWDVCLDMLLGGVAGTPAGPQRPASACTLQWRSASAACSTENHWKYGTEGLPVELGRSAALARSRYAAADLRYLEGDADTGRGKGRAYGVLDRSCAAMAQGPYRLQRGLAYAAYDRLKLATSRPRSVGIAPGCVHDVACVFPSAAGRAALLGD